MPLKLSAKKDKSKTTRFALIVLIILVFILLLGKISEFGKTLSSPWMDQKNTEDKSYTWDSTFNINIVLEGSDIFLLSYNPQNKAVVLIPMPKNTYVDVAYGMGQWQLGSVFSLGETSSTSGAILTKRTISALFGVAVDGFVKLKGSLSDKKGDQLIDALKKGPLNIFLILSDLKSDLTLWELIRLKFALSEVRFDKVKILDLQKLDIMSVDKLPDKTAVYTIDNIKLDGILESLVDITIRDEGLTISVLNGTSEPLLAQKAARILTNTGANVIVTSNTVKKFKRNYIYGKESKTLTRLVQIFNSPCSEKEECDKIEPELKPETNFSRADINVILGEDFAGIY